MNDLNGPPIDFPTRRRSRRSFSLPGVCDRCSDLDFPNIPLSVGFRYLKNRNLDLPTLTQAGLKYLKNRHLELLTSLGPYSSLLQNIHCPLCQLFSSTFAARTGSRGSKDDIPTGNLSLYAFSNATFFSDLSNFPEDDGLGAQTRWETFYAVIPDNYFPDNDEDPIYKVPSSLGHLEVTRYIMPRGWISQGRPSHLETRDFAARLVNPDKLDIDLVRGWVKTCLTDHGASCGDNLMEFKGMVPFKVIDCESKVLITAPQGCHYVAFSYVWGQATSAVEGGRLPSEIPKSIRDAIELTQKLGYKYLWVDRYCISQDSPNEKHAQIQQMNLIYLNARLTVIAAAGTDPSYGLPGISRPRNIHQPVARHERGLLTSTFPDAAIMIKESKWLTRAWTYQEALLSRRCLVITDYQAYFECSNMHCYEAVNTPPCKWVAGIQYGTCSCRRSTIFSFADVCPNSLGAWKLIVDYTSRQLTHEEDILDGISGVFREFQFLNQPFYFHWGIPISGKESAYGRRASRTLDMTSRFATALCWRHDSPKKRRSGFPSWSWVGWLGPVAGWIGPVDFQSFLTVMVRKDPNVPISFKIDDSSGKQKDIAEFLVTSKISSPMTPLSPFLHINTSIISLTLHTPSTYQGQRDQIKGEIWAKITVSTSHYIWIPVDVTASNLALLDLYHSKFDGVILGPISKEDGLSRDFPPTAIIITKRMEDFNERVGFIVIYYPCSIWRDTKKHFRRDSRGVERFNEVSEMVLGNVTEIAREQKSIKLR